MYRVDPKGGNQPQTWRAHSLTARNVISLPMAGNDPRDLWRPPAAAPARGSCCSGCAKGGSCKGHSHSHAGLGDLVVGGIDLNTLGWTGYAALGLGVWLAGKVLFTGDRAKQRRAALKAAEADYRMKRDQISKQYPRL